MPSHKFLVLLFFISCGLSHFSCKNKSAQQPLFDLMENTGIDFKNKVVDQEINNSFLFRNFYNGGGVALGDINNDGLADVFLTSNMEENKVYLNKGDFKFEDISAKSGIKQDSQWCTGVVMADVNADGWLDVYVCSSGHMQDGKRMNKLYINNHNLTFTESAAKYGLDIKGYATQVSFFDYDLDGDLDCFLINNSPVPVNTLNNANRRDLPDAEWPVADFLKGGGDHLYRNENGFFREVTRKAGIHGSLISFGLGVSVGDINGDNYPDVYVSNDSYERDYLYINQRDGTFKDELEKCMQHTSFSSMGADIADINNDDYPEVFTTDMLQDDDYRLKTVGSFDNIDLYRSKVSAGFYQQFIKNCLHLNTKNGRFVDIGNYSGVSATDWSWGALMFDADNDGYNDIYVCNGVNRDVTNLDFMDFFANDVIQKMVLSGKKDNVNEVLAHIPKNPIPNKAYRNLGNLKFQDMGNDWGFMEPSFSNGAAYADLDNDGDLDMIVSNENQQAFVYKNHSREFNKNNYISLSLIGHGANTFAIGSKVKAYKDGQIFNRELIPSRGFQSSVDYKIIIGLGKLTEVDSLVIIWPDLSKSKIEKPTLNKSLVFNQPAHNFIKDSGAIALAISPWLIPMKIEMEKHHEDDYVDFYYERNIPMMLSREGPKAAVGDVNGDGYADIFTGGAGGKVGCLYLQTAKGGLVKKNEPAFEQFMDFEDDAVLFFDADGDKDLDLYIGPGGNSNPPFSRQMQSRLFKNDGKGNFQLDAAAFPANGMNTSVAVAYDFDKDGDEDLFVGGRSIPRDYGSTPTSFLYVNDGKGHFTDVAKTQYPVLSSIGMVTSALWIDLNGDKEKELVIVGEWMAPRIFNFKTGKLQEIETNLKHLKGWWQTVTAADLDGDGDQDLVLGNIGENFYLRPQQDKPVRLWINDFNHNGTKDQILTQTINGKDMPVFLKHEMQDQIPVLKKQNLKHEEFAKKSIQELFSSEEIKTSAMIEFNYASSCVAINEGNGQFTIKNLPAIAQLSSINATHCMDINKDGAMDIVIAGNQFGFLPQFGRLDAGTGDVLLNNGKGTFNESGPIKSGLLIEGEVRDIAEIRTHDKTCLIFLRNNDYPSVYEVSQQPGKLNNQ